MTTPEASSLLKLCHAEFETLFFLPIMWNQSQSATRRAPSFINKKPLFEHFSSPSFYHLFLYFNESLIGPDIHQCVHFIKYPPYMIADLVVLLPAPLLTSIDLVFN